MERGKEGLREEKGEMAKTKGHTRTCMESQHSRRFLKYSPTQRRSEWGHQIAGEVEPQLDQRKHLGGAEGGKPSSVDIASLQTMTRDQVTMLRCARLSISLFTMCRCSLMSMKCWVVS